jgi:hypothetical protein
MRHHLENLKQKPEHVRHRVALGASVGATAFVALIWFVAHAATDSFALSAPTQAPSPESEAASAELADATSGLSQLAGAFGGMLGATSTEPELTIVDGNTTSTLDSAPAENQNQTNATAISF